MPSILVLETAQKSMFFDHTTGVSFVSSFIIPSPNHTRSE
jgi:hypothetical protein